MLILTVFARVLRASVEERIFGDPDSAINLRVGIASSFHVVVIEGFSAQG